MPHLVSRKVYAIACNDGVKAQERAEAAEARVRKLESGCVVGTVRIPEGES